MFNLDKEKNVPQINLILSFKYFSIKATLIGRNTSDNIYPQFLVNYNVPTNLLSE